MFGIFRSICPACVLVPVVMAGVALIATGFTDTTAPGPDLPRPDPVSPGYRASDEDRALLERHKGDDRFVLGYEMKRITGEPESLVRYHGKVVLIVNVASRCGLTPQYAGLERLYRAHHDAGLVVLGFPANNFMGQEPGSNKQILEFCTGEYDVSFPMFEKISVKGDDVHPLYRQLAALPAPYAPEDAESAGPTWNFTKYLVGRDGRVIRRFDPRTQPDDEKFLEAVAEALKVKAG